ncbi:MAG: SlyX family protein [Desulfuromonadales bacterium]|nr:SlyX family protein [Desulfuromonadales bacterium]
MTELEQRLVELEIRYTHQSSQLDELNDELTRANGRIDQLLRDVQRLLGMVASMAPQTEESPDE